VAYFIEPLLRHHDRDYFEVVGVLSHTWKDEKTEELKSLCDEWIEAGSLSDHDLAQCLRDQRIDIAVDLICHSQGSRALTFAQKPAPIQVTMIGMQQTTGLQSMDFRVTDSIMDPPGVTERFHSEELMRLPVAFCLQPPTASPAIAPLPALETGHITFASFNNFAKAHSGVLHAWAAVLNRIPHSRLVVVAPDGTTLESTMAQAGIAPERIIIRPRRTGTDYLHMHDDVDIMLDCFPFVGLTVSVIAAWMGVPTLTIAGTTPSARAGASLMSSIDLDTFVASDTEDFVNKAESLSADLQHLSAVRASMRERMAVHLTNGESYTRTFEQKLRTAWEDWCQTAPDLQDR
jgi:predicted O-linked N-acetylglucosamine transferase (SPINDLY family)